VFFDSDSNFLVYSGSKGYYFNEECSFRDFSLYCVLQIYPVFIAFCHCVDGSYRMEKEGESMTISGWVLMIFTWTAITLLLVFCFYATFRTGK
jgi:hypothetical protein